MMLAAAGLAVSPVASNAAASLSIARAAPQLSGASYFAGEAHGNRTAMVALGGLLLVLLAVVAIAGSSANHAQNPHSP
jgi:amino acid transporter